VLRLLLRKLKKLNNMNDIDTQDDFQDFIDELEGSSKNDNAQCSIDNPEDCEACGS
jgi:hypothetical protein